MNHPTKQILIDTAVILLDELPMEKVTSELELEKSKISKGTLYHHFPDFGHLIDEAQVLRFSRYVDGSIDAIAHILQNAASADEIKTTLRALTADTQSEQRSKDRRNRLQLLGLATQRPYFEEILGREQERLTAGLADLVREAQEKGWIRLEFSPRAVALLIQSYTLGVWLDDITPNRIPAHDWVTLINAVVENVLLAPAQP